MKFWSIYKKHTIKTPSIKTELIGIPNDSERWSGCWNVTGRLETNRARHLGVWLSFGKSFLVKDNGDTILQNRGILNDREIRKIQEFIKQNYQEMYLKLSEYSIESYYEKKN